jgi:hypothetical protein
MFPGLKSQLEITDDTGMEDQQMEDQQEDVEE